MCRSCERHVRAATHSIEPEGTALHGRNFARRSCRRRIHILAEVELAREDKPCWNLLADAAAAAASCSVMRAAPARRAHPVPKHQPTTLSEEMQGTTPVSRKILRPHTVHVATALPVHLRLRTGCQMYRHSPDQVAGVRPDPTWTPASVRLARPCHRARSRTAVATALH